ncbi:MAG: BON domain-containing protein [Planctomycetaceae bacterium]|nr:BON domain-containing protein [Planctomycetaceae bacterium]
MQRAVKRVPQFFGPSVQVDVADEGIVISGVVGSYYHKQMAQESLRGVSKTAPIHNRLSVRTRAVAR